MIGSVETCNALRRERSLPCQPERRKKPLSCSWRQHAAPIGIRSTVLRICAPGASSSGRQMAALPAKKAPQKPSHPLHPHARSQTAPEAQASAAICPAGSQKRLRLLEEESSKDWGELGGMLG